MKRFHVHAHVEDLAASVAFYSTLFGAAPTRVEGDYAKWMLDDPRINFAISTRGSALGVDHLGMQTDTADELAELQARAETADMTLLDVGETSCCRAQRQILADRSARHRLGALPHPGQHSGLQREGPCCADGRCGLLRQPHPAWQAGGRGDQGGTQFSLLLSVSAAKSTPMQKVCAEGLGTALLLTVVIGSGVMGERLSGGNAAIALLANALATVGGLYVLIELIGPISGAHFNPAVSLVMAARGALNPRLLAPYLLAQLLGAMLGAWLAHAMFDMNILQLSTRVRSGSGQWIAETVATFGLLLVVLRAPAARAPALVAAYIGAAYWFTASTSFANPAATFGRMFSDSFAGIAPSSAPGFVLAQLLGATLAAVVHGAAPSHD